MENRHKVMETAQPLNIAKTHTCFQNISFLHTVLAGKGPTDMTFKQLHYPLKSTQRRFHSGLHSKKWMWVALQYNYG